MPASFVAPLSHNALLSVTGDDATAFLHGQFTNDVQALDVGHAQWNGWCSPKGRLLATFVLLKRAEGYLLMLPAELAAPIAKRLSMFVLRSKVKVAEVTREHAMFGAVHRDLPGALQVGDRISVLVVDKDFHVPVNGTEADWDHALIDAGIPVILAATQDAFVPQMVNFELVGGVSFRKGCYPGQEIVARTQYRGILKRRMARAHVEGGSPQPGQPVYGVAFGEQAAGQIVNVAASDTAGHDLLVCAQIESLRAGDLRLGSPDGPALHILSHPAAAAA
jgi:tRNA-modifying protein YgfZ